MLVRGGKVALFFAFAFAVMADPVSSVAYAIEAALRALNGHLELLLPTMSIVIGIIALVTLNYWQLVRAFPEGGGSPEAAGRAFGEEWSFLPIGALIVDFALTIAISIAAAGSALIAYVPALAPARIPLAMALLALVAGLTWFGHGGRLVFARDDLPLHRRRRSSCSRPAGSRPTPLTDSAPITGSASPALVAVILAFPVAMALATGTEAPATSIAQLGQLDNRGRWRFGRGTLALTIVIVGGLTLGPDRARRPPQRRHSRQRRHADREPRQGRRRRRARSSGSSSSPAACCCWPPPRPPSRRGPACSRRWPAAGPDGIAGLLPGRLARRHNEHHTPVLAVVVYAVISAAIILAASGQEQELVLVYAVAVFVSFLAGLLAMARFSRRQRGRACCSRST